MDNLVRPIMDSLHIKYMGLQDLFAIYYVIYWEYVIVENLK